MASRFIDGETSDPKKVMEAIDSASIFGVDFREVFNIAIG